MGIYGIYDKNNKEQCLRVGTIDEIVKFFGLSARGFDLILKKGIYKNRFEIMYLYEEAYEGEM